jgi:hypothetical protein
MPGGSVNRMISWNRRWATKTDPEWSGRREAALGATRRTDLSHGPNAAYVHGCVCSGFREHQTRPDGKTAASSSHSVSYRYS